MWVLGLTWFGWICPSVCCDPSSHGLKALGSADYWATKPVWAFCLLLCCFWLNVLWLTGFKWGWTKFFHLLGLEFELKKWEKKNSNYWMLGVQGKACNSLNRWLPHTIQHLFRGGKNKDVIMHSPKLGGVLMLIKAGIIWSSYTFDKAVCAKTLVFTNKLTTNSFSSFEEKTNKQIFPSNFEKCSPLKHIIFYGEGTGEGKRIPKGSCIMLLGHCTENCAHFHTSLWATCVWYYTCTQGSFFSLLF